MAESVRRSRSLSRSLALNILTCTWCTGLKQSEKTVRSLLLSRSNSFLQFMKSGTALDLDESPTFVETWKEMEKLLDTGIVKLFPANGVEPKNAFFPGKVKSIGVSNFSIPHLETLLAHAKVVPVTNQVEVHPFYPSFELQKYCESKGISLTAYSPLGTINSFVQT